MKIKSTASKWLLLALLSLTLPAVLTTSCKKSSNNNDDVTPQSGDVRDSVYMVAEDVYLWTDQLPTLAAFKPTSYPGPDEVIEKIKTYSPLLNGKNIDHYSFGLPKEEYENLASGNETDYGCGFKFVRSAGSDYSDDLRISYVYSNSSAGTQGVARGWRVMSINGIAANTNNVNSLNTALNTGTVSVQFKTPANDTKTLTLAAGLYTANTVVKCTTLTVGTKKVGYIMFNTFFGTAIPEINTAFADFASKNVTDVVVDLRYNGGGQVNIAEHFANLLAPASAKGKQMYTDQHNALLTSLGWNETKNYDNEARRLPLLEKVAFIGTAGTASASELLINVLKPYLGTNQALFGSTTYGKPVGFYPIPVNRNKQDEYYTLIVAVKTTNSAGNSDYYQGFTPDVPAVDDLTHDFGDPEEASLKSALAWIESGTLSASTRAIESVTRQSPMIDAANIKFDRSFKGTIFKEKTKK
ncbi:S41 family peptidase [Solitalea canadensis]|uniref:Periplasmic protease n=1 Tax=Solitalea canadensis (strain ATCC 29591 / DSM 3403 / JCM 21819 / LMG 8368 / NBRC 15130 / NCIMB 12057 / USAM 9D) TaxID=929556 RepID=H8KLS8_SOLCM|nr:S41 family peptidase [Solitalea canadensis]AFD09232.1 periplasmic protease [Solitalea canadensis DSM 3403]